MSWENCTACRDFEARLPDLPNVPTMAEAGYPDVNAIFWSGVFALAGTLPDIVAKLQTTLAQTVRDGGVGVKLKTLAVRPSDASPEGFKRTIDEEIARHRASRAAFRGLGQLGTADPLGVMVGCRC